MRKVHLVAMTMTMLAIYTAMPRLSRAAPGQACDDKGGKSWVCTGDADCNDTHVISYRSEPQRTRDLAALQVASVFRSMCERFTAPPAKMRLKIRDITCHQLN